MIEVINSIIPVKGKKAMCVFPFIFIRKNTVFPFTPTDRNHEYIHGIQQIEMLVVGFCISLILFFSGLSWWGFIALPLFYWWYVIEWLIRLMTSDNPYRSISFEREAYTNERNFDYLKSRKLFSWVRYLKS